MILEAIAKNLNTTVNAVREKNFYQVNQLTPYLQPLKQVSASSS